MFRQVGGLLFFTMEYLEGLTLRQILLKYRRLPLGKAVGIIHRVCVTLEYAHQYAVHRDISPENIMILSDATVRLLDFGIAKALDLQGLSQKELPIGKSYYMSPEQRDNPATVDARTDIFSLGVVLFEMLTGELPSGYNRLTQVRPDVPEMLEKVIGWALATRDQRYPTARHFRKAVDGCYKIYKKNKDIAKPQTPQEKPVQKNGAPPGSPKKGMPETLRTAQADWEEWERHLEQRRAERVAAPPVPPPAKPGWLSIAEALRKWTKKE